MRRVLQPRFGDHVRHFVFQHSPLKQSPNSDGAVAAAALAAMEQGDESAAGYMSRLLSSRDRLLALLDGLSSQPAEVVAALQTYLGLLLELAAATPQDEQQRAAQAEVAELLRSALGFTWDDTILPVCQVGGSSGSTNSSIVKGASRGSSRWFGAAARKRSALATAAAAASAGAGEGAADAAHFEAASASVAVACWQLAKASALAAASDDAEAALGAYELYRVAAGLLEYTCSQLVVPHLDGDAGADLQPTMLTALRHLALAEAQSLMMQRALAQTCQGSTIAGMAVDTAVLFSQCFADLHASARAVGLPWAEFAPQQQQQQSPRGRVSNGSSDSGSSSGRNSRMVQFEQVLGAELPWEWPEPVLHVLVLAAYAQYQVGAAYCLSVLCAAEACLSNNKAGEAVALAQMGTNLVAKLQDIGADASTVLDMHAGTGAQDSRRRLLLEAMLEHKAAGVHRKAVRENRTMYLQYIPGSSNTLPWPRRAAHAEPFARPPPPPARLAPAAAQTLLSGAAFAAVTVSAAAAAGAMDGSNRRAAALSEPQEVGLLAAAAAAVEASVCNVVAARQAATSCDDTVEEGDEGEADAGEPELDQQQQQQAEELPGSPAAAVAAKHKVDESLQPAVTHNDDGCWLIGNGGIHSGGSSSGALSESSGPVDTGDASSCCSTSSRGSASGAGGAGGGSWLQRILCCRVPAVQFDGGDGDQDEADSEDYDGGQEVGGQQQQVCHGKLQKEEACQPAAAWWEA